jgi:hypothetical protein
MQALRERLTVKPEDLRRRLDPATLPFQTTAEVAPVETTIGQPRGRGDRLCPQGRRARLPPLRRRFAGHRAREHRTMARSNQQRP